MTMLPAQLTGGLLSFFSRLFYLSCLTSMIFGAASDSGWLIQEALKYDGETIAHIEFEPAAQPLSNSEMRAKLPFHEGSTFREAELRTAIQSLYETGRFADIEVDAFQNQKDVVLRFVTTPAYFVGHIAINGVDIPPNRGELIAATRLRLGTTFFPENAMQATASMKDLLRENGFYHARIAPEIYYDQHIGTAALTFSIKPGKRARFEQPALVGNPAVSMKSLIRATRWKRIYGFSILGIPVWNEVTEARIRQGLNNIRKYYDKRDLLESRVTLSGREYHGVTNTVEPVIHISPGRRVAVRVVGAHIDQASLKSLVPIFQERSIDNDLLQEGERNIEQYLQGQGFFGAQAKATLHSGSVDRLTTVTYTVTRGERHQLVLLGISGNLYFPADVLRDRLYEVPVEFPRYPHGRFSTAYLQRDVEAIQNLYVSNGFRRVKVTSSVVDDFSGVRGHLAVFLKITEGVQSLVSNLTIKGIADSDRRTINAMIACSRGQPFSETNALKDRENVLNFYYDHGYLSASFEYTAQRMPDDQHIELLYVVTPGRRTFVRDVIVSGLQTTRRNLVLKRIAIKKGEPLSLAQQTESQRRLYDLGVFARVNTALQNPEGKEDAKNVLYDIDEARHYSLNVGGGAQIARIGGGATTLNNPAGSAGFAPRVAVGLTRENLLGLGQSLGVQTALSTIEQRVALTYFVPHLVDNPNLNLTTVVFLDNSNDVRTFTAHRREASIQLGEKLTKATTVQYRVVLRNVSLSNLKIDQLLVPLLSQPETVGLVECSLIQDRRDDPTDAHRGTYSTVDLSYAPGVLGSQTEFGRALFRNSSYYQLGRNLVLARGTQFGVITRTGGRPNVPLAERLYSGGSTSIRAFPDFQAGPRDLVTGFPLGGDALFINNTELRFPLYGDTIGGVLFHDAGNVYNSLGDFSLRFRQENLQDFNYLVQNIGFGIRYRTPIGPIRVDLSISPDAPRFFGLKGTLQDYVNGSAAATVQKINAFQFHISLGQAF